MELARLIDFSAKKYVKKPKPINKNRTVFVLYAPERIVLRSCEAKVINMQTKIKLPHAINAKIWLLLSLIKEHISIEKRSRTCFHNTTKRRKRKIQRTR